MVELSFERLYLAKNNNQDIYVENCPLVQHQLDGIRFLYRAFKKKNQAVIVNDPSGYGKRVQTALFLSAVLPMLSKPVLILTRDGAEQQWLSCFQQWTQLSDDVAIELSNPFAKRKVIISALYCAAAFARRQWSVLVVDSDLISKDLQKSTLRPELIIWITSTNIKEDLEKYSTFHSWVFPKDKFVADKYKANKRDLSSVLLKRAMLDAFLEDTVLRRDFAVAPFSKGSSNTAETKTKSDNKDATGTKTKRSKRKSADINKVAKETPSKVAKTKNNTIENTEEFLISVPDVERQTNVENTKGEMDNVEIRRRCKKNQVIWDSEDSEGELNEAPDRRNENDIASQLDSEQSITLRLDSDTDSKNGTHDSRLDTNQSNYKLELGKPNSTNNDKITVNDLQNNCNLLEKNEIDLHKVENEINSDINNVKYNSEDLFATNPNELNFKVEEIITEAERNEVKPSPNNLENSSLKPEELNENTDKKDSGNANLSSFELKMKKLEELALKKYKGTFLDSLF